MDTLDKLLEGLGLKYEDLKPDERKVYQQWYHDLSVRPITTEDIRGYIASMRAVVDDALAHEDNTKVQDILLKARLRNYILLEAFLSSPERAKKALERQIGQTIKGKNYGT